MKYVILGMSRFSVQLARLLAEQKHTLTVIDRNPEAFRRLGKEFPAQYVLGIGIDESILRKAHIEQADAFIAATDSDATNLMAAQVAKEVFEVKRCIARVHDESRVELFNSMGLEVICPTLQAATQLALALREEPA